MSKESYVEKCAHIQRPPHVLTINDDIVKAIANDFRALPIFEKTLFDYNYIKYYSLHTNEFLSCRWRSYIQHFFDREFAPFQFVDIRDFHFYNCRNRLIPKESIHTKTDFRRKLRNGPGVDFCGQMPIPQELLMKRGTPKPHTGHNKGRKTFQENKTKQVIDDKNSMQNKIIDKK